MFATVLGFIVMTYFVSIPGFLLFLYIRSRGPRGGKMSPIKINSGIDQVRLNSLALQEGSVLRLEKVVSES